MVILRLLALIGLVVVSFFSWSEEESEITSTHDCYVMHRHLGHVPIYSCSGGHSHNYSNDEKSTQGLKWFPIVVSILAIAALFLVGLDVDTRLFIHIGFLAIYAIYIIYYLISYNEKEIGFLIAGGLTFFVIYYTARDGIDIDELTS